MSSKFCIHFVCVWYWFRVKDCLAVQESKVNTKPISTVFLGNNVYWRTKRRLKRFNDINSNISFTSLLTASSNENGMERFLTYIGDWLAIRILCTKTFVTPGLSCKTSPYLGTIPISRFRSSVDIHLCTSAGV